MTTLYTHHLVTWVRADLADTARAALLAVAGVPVAGYPAQLTDGADGEARGEWSACREGSLDAFLWASREICGEGAYAVVEGVHAYAGEGGAWAAWPREATPTQDTQRALEWLAAQGWAIVEGV